MAGKKQSPGPGVELVPAKQGVTPGGRPRIVINPELIEELSALACTVEEMAAVLRISVRSLMRRFEEDGALNDGNGGPITEALDIGFGRGCVAVRRLMWRHAKGHGGAAVAATKHLAAHMLGETDRSLIEMSGPGGRPIKIMLSQLDMQL